MADTDIKIKLTADPKPVRDAIKLIDRDLKELGGPVIGNGNDTAPPNPPDKENNTNGQSSTTNNSDRINQSRRDRTNQLILRELTALRRELQKTNQNRTSSTPPPGAPPPTTPPPSPDRNGPNPPPPGGGPDNHSDDSQGGNNKIVEAIGKLGALWSALRVVNQWANSSQSRESQAYRTYGSLLAYDDYNIAGRDAVNAGKKYGYNYDVTMAAQKANMRYAGFTNLESLQADSQALLRSSKAWGLDPSQVSSVSGRLTGFGTFKVGEQQKFANMLAQSIQEHGMHGREDQELQVLQGISENLASRNTTLTEDTLRSGLNIYSALATINPNLRGERGGNLAEKMINTAAQDDNLMDIMAGKNTEFIGVEGQLNLWKMKEQDPNEYWKRVIQGADKFGWSDSNIQYMLHGSGFSVDESEQMIKAVRSGGTFDLNRDTSAGEEAERERTENYQQADVSKLEEFDITLQSARDEIGAILNDIKSTFLDIFNNMSPGGQMVTTAASSLLPIIGGGFVMSKLGGLGGLLGAAGAGGAGAGGGLSGLLGGLNPANAGKWAGITRIGGAALTGGIAAYNTYDNLQKGDYRSATGSATGGIGAIGAGLAGAKIGAGIGTLFGPIGTVLGALIGGGAGALAGNYAGEKFGEFTYDKIVGNDEDRRHTGQSRQSSVEDTERRNQERGVGEINTPPQSAHLGGMREFTPQDQMRLIQQTSYGVYRDPYAVTSLSYHPDLMTSRRELDSRTDDNNDDDSRQRDERQFRLMEQDTRAIAENTKAITANTKQLEKNNKGSFLERLLKGSNKTASPTSSMTPVVKPASPTVPTSPSQAGKIIKPSDLNYSGSGGKGEGDTWLRQGDNVSFEGAQPELLDAVDMLAKFYKENTGNRLVVTAGTNGDHPSNGTEHGHDAGWKVDINDWGFGEHGALTADGGGKGYFTDQLIAYGRSLGLGMNWEGDHLDVALDGTQWDGNGEDVGGFSPPKNMPTPKSHAHGNEYVPYDNYPALLHKGERVLTRLEANELRDLPGIHLPQELQIDEAGDSISDRKYKRAAQEQYQYNNSHTFTGLPTTNLNDRVSGGKNTPTTLKPGDQGYDLQQRILKERGKRIWNKYHKTPTRDVSEQVPPEQSTPSVQPTSTTTPPSYKFDDYTAIPQNTTGLELLLSLKSKTDDKGNLVYGTDSGYNRITDDDTRDVARLKRQAQLRNTSTTDALSRYYISQRLETPPTTTLPTESTIPMYTPPPSVEDTSPTVTSSTTTTLPEKPKEKSSRLSKILSKSGDWLGKTLSNDTQLAKVLTSVFGKKKSVEAITQNLGPLFQMMGKGKQNSKTPPADKSKNPLQSLHDQLFKKDGSINLDSGMWQSKGIPQPIEPTIKPKEQRSILPENQDISIADIPEAIKQPTIYLPKADEETEKPKEQDKKSKAGWLQQNAALFKILGAGAKVAGQYETGKKTWSRVGKVLSGISSHAPQIEKFYNQVFKKKDKKDEDGAQIPKSGDQPTTVPKFLEQSTADIPKADLKPDGDLIAGKDNPIKSIVAPSPTPQSPAPAQQPIDTSSAGMAASSISVELTVHVDGKIDGMTNENQGIVVQSLVKRFNSPDWLPANGFTRTANK